MLFRWLGSGCRCGIGGCILRWWCNRCLLGNRCGWGHLRLSRHRRRRYGGRGLLLCGPHGIVNGGSRLWLMANLGTVGLWWWGWSGTESTGTHNGLQRNNVGILRVFLGERKQTSELARLHSQDTVLLSSSSFIPWSRVDTSSGGIMFAQHRKIAIVMHQYPRPTSPA